MAEKIKKDGLINYIAFAAAVISGFGVWASSPYITGRGEPWDADFPFYSIVLVVAGIIVGFLSPRKIWICFLGVWLGQLCALAILPLPGGDGWFLLGAITTGIGTLASLVGWGIGAFAGSKSKAHFR